MGQNSMGFSKRVVFFFLRDARDLEGSMGVAAEDSIG